MNDNIKELANKLLHKNFEELTEIEQNIIKRISGKMFVSRNTNTEFYENLTIGQKLADKVAEFGGSWPFIIFFLASLLCWVFLNTFILARHGEEFDPYPYILLNLVLSMIASIQAPVIMMSQNRHNAKDRLDAKHDYEVNLKAELEIMELHHKMDTLLEKQWVDLITLQQEQIKLLNEIKK